jgi:hypothetical protein
MISKVNLHQTPLPRSLNKAEQEVVQKVESLYSGGESNQAISFAIRNLSQDVYDPTLHNLFHKKHVENWQKSLNPVQKVLHSVLGDNAPKFLVPPKPEHPDVIKAREHEARLRSNHISMTRGSRW